MYIVLPPFTAPPPLFPLKLELKIFQRSFGLVLVLYKLSIFLSTLVSITIFEFDSCRSITIDIGENLKRKGTR